MPISEQWIVDANFGRQTVEDNAGFGWPDYNTWGLAVSYNHNDFILSFAYVDTNISKIDCVDGCESRGIFSIGKTF